MKYGYFDDEKREYVITRPDTPAPWANYLGSPEYGAIISNNAGGYSFAKSGANGRILRYVFNDFDEPGRYIYVRDDDDGDFWSASWAPVKKDLSLYSCECRHGTAYTRMISDYKGIHTEVTYYVPLNAEYEVWYLSITNQGEAPRNISITGYAEFTNNCNYEQDQVNLQYSQYISSTTFDNDRITQCIHGNLDGLEDGKDIDDKVVTQRFLGLAGSDVEDYCGDRKSFLGNYHRYDNPVSIIEGKMNRALNYNENACGALMTGISLMPGETRTMCFIVGMKYRDEAAEIMSHYRNPGEICPKELSELINEWHSRFMPLQVKTPSKEFDSMINTWNAYNCFMTFTWSRAASFIYCGLRNGYGYRDTVQDIQGIIHLRPEMAADKIRFMLSAQVDNGGGLPLVKFTHNPGHEDTPDDESYVRETGHPAYRADDALWLFPTIYKYIAETGNADFLSEEIPYANKGSATVYDHLKKAIDFSISHMGTHGMPAGLYADWNDCLRLGANGESSFVAMQLYYAMNILKDFATAINDTGYADWLQSAAEQLEKTINLYCWDKDQFVRGYTEDGTIIGGRDDPEANIWLNPQSWAVISGLATKKQAESALGKVGERLNTDFGLMLMDPPYHAHAFGGALAVIYNAGAKENAGIFSQSQGWIILAEALMGHGDNAFRYYLENCPAAQNDKAEVRVLEPFCYGQFTEGKASPHFGRSHVHWLTGTASTMMVGCVEGILGIRPDISGLRIAPSIPSEWDGLEIQKEFRGKKLNIRIVNPMHRESGFTSITLNGENLPENYVEYDRLLSKNEIVLVL